MSPAPNPLALEHNLALMAGAGAGKTYSLVTMTLHLLAGAREGALPLRPQRLCMLTFTEKAAAQMRERLRQRLEALALGDARAPEERELAASLERLGRPFPPPDAWRRLREELPFATVGTFHALCGNLLRRAPPGLGVDPSFEVLDELEARSLVLDTCERVVLEALEAGEPAVRELTQELSFAGAGTGEGLVTALAGVWGKLREEGLPAASARVSDPDEGRARFEARVAEARALVDEARALDARGEWADLLAALGRALDGMGVLDALEPHRLPALRAAFARDGRSPVRLSRGAGGVVRQLYWRVFGKSDGTVPRLEDALAGWRVAPFEAAFRALLERVEQRHAAELERRNVLDFTALLVRTRDLLRDHPTFRRQVQERIGALLVDEFQDTNRLQLELVLLLAERREGAPRALEPARELAAQLPLEPAMLCAVGDRKQSIYEFRGADVSVFGQLADKLVAEGGQRAFLQHNRRSVPALLDFFNGAFAGLLTASSPPRPYEVAYVPAEDDLTAVRPAGAPGAAVERLVVGEADGAGELRAREADALARRLKALLAPDAPPSVVRPGGAGPERARGGDVAILLRTFTHLELYRQALVRHGVPHRVLRGRGFYGAQEVLDLAALLALVADPDDVLALATVLRSPLVGLSDGALFRLTGARGVALSLAALERTPDDVLGALGAGERLRLERFLAALPPLRRERDRLGVRALLQAALDVTGYREALAGTPYAEQALGNVDKLLGLAARRDAQGAGGCVPFARELRRLAESDPTEAQAELLDAADPRAVQLLTIHRAKGLEWPIVVVPALGGRRRSPKGRAHFDRTLGLALKPWLPELDGPHASARFDAVRAELAAREGAEYRRLLYVALTRARDRLVLSGADEPGTSGTWWQLLARRLEADASLRAQVLDVDAAALPGSPADDEGPPPTPAARARAEAALARVRMPVPAPVPLLAVAATGAVADHLRCPRRYHYLHRVGLAEPGHAWEPPRGRAAWVERGAAWGGPRPGRAELARRLLAHADLARALEPAPERRAHLEALLRTHGADASQEDAAAALALAERFLGTAFARRVGGSPPARLLRRQPYTLSLGAGGGAPAALEGELDLLWLAPDGEAWAVTWVATARPPEGARALADELWAHALAAARRLGPGVRVRAAAAFLAEPTPEPEPLETPAGDAPARAERLRAAAEALARADGGRAWEGRERATCQALRCGYQERCHPGPRP